MTNVAKKVLYTCFLVFVLLGDMAFPFVTRALIEWAPRRVSREIWGVGVRTIAMHPLGEELSQFNRVEVETLDNEILELAPPDLNNKLTLAIARSVEKLKLFSDIEVTASPQIGEISSVEQLERELTNSNIRFSRSYTPNDHAKAPQFHVPGNLMDVNTDRTLIIRGALVDYYAGHRILRLIGGGLGKGTIAVHLQFLDKQTNQELGKVSIAGDFVRCSYGQTQAAVPNPIGRRVAKLIKEHYRIDQRHGNQLKMVMK